MGKIHSKPLAARHGRGTAWVRHGHGMLCVNRPLRFQELRLPGLYRKENFMEETYGKSTAEMGRNHQEGFLLQLSKRGWKRLAVHRNIWSGGQDPKRVVALLLKEEDKKIQIKRSTRRSIILLTANCHLFTCIPVFVHWALRWNCKLDLPVELDDPVGKTKPHSIWPCFGAVLLTCDNLTKGYRTCVLRTFVYITD
jgi:hypothetical protein